ncbi:unnamed protein product [Leptosia nina]|uniref:Uncharacterized protein n=1 Tax=Leptosia nina TaxID=320188 RepID=A0AAV1JGT8_9NEOP
MNDRFDVELQMVNNKEVTQVNKIKESPGNDVTALGTVGARQNQRTWVLFSFGGGGDDDGDDDDDEEEDRYYLGTLLLLLATEVYCACVGSWDGLIYTGA